LRIAPAKVPDRRRGEGNALEADDAVRFDALQLATVYLTAAASLAADAADTITARPMPIPVMANKNWNDDFSTCLPPLIASCGLHMRHP
jgi:hypothetical protein